MTMVNTSTDPMLDYEQSLFFSSVSHARERASSGEAARREKRGRQPEKKKDRLPAQPEPMKYALASQRKNTIGWCVKRWQQTVNNRNHWQVDDGWSTAGLFVMFPENWHSIKKQNNLSPVLTLLIFCNFADWFWKNLIFQLFCDLQLASNQNTRILMVAAQNSIVEDQISVKWGWQAYPTPTVRGICTFAVFVSVSPPFMSLHSCLWRALRVVFLDRAMANFKRS